MSLCGKINLEVYDSFDSISDESVRAQLTGPVTIVPDGDKYRALVFTNMIESKDHFRSAYACALARNFTVDRLLEPEVARTLYAELRAEASDFNSPFAQRLREADEALPNNSQLAVRAAASYQAKQGFRDEGFNRWAMGRFKSALVSQGWVAPEADFEAIRPFIQQLTDAEGVSSTILGEAQRIAAREIGPQATEVEPDRDNRIMQVYQMTGKGNEFRDAVKHLTQWEIPATKTMSYMFGGQFFADIAARKLASEGVDNSVSFLFMNHSHRVTGRVSQALADHWKPVSEAIVRARDAKIWATNEELSSDVDIYLAAISAKSRNAAWRRRKIPLKSGPRRIQEDTIKLLQQNSITPEIARQRLDDLAIDENIDISAARKRFKDLKGKTDQEVLVALRSLSGMSDATADAVIAEMSQDGKVDGRGGLRELAAAMVAANDGIYALHQQAGITGLEQDRLFRGLDNIENFVTFKDNSNASGDAELAESDFSYNLVRVNPFAQIGQATGRFSLPTGLLHATENAIVRAAGVAETQTFMKDLFNQLTASQEVVNSLGITVSGPKKMKFTSEDGELPRLSIRGIEKLRSNQYLTYQNGEARVITVENESMVQALNDLYRPLDRKEAFGFEPNLADRAFGVLGDLPVLPGVTVGKATRFIAATFTRLKPTFWPVQVMRDISQVIPAVLTEDIGGLKAGLRSAQLVFTGNAGIKMMNLFDLNDVARVDALRKLAGSKDPMDRHLADFIRSGGASTFAAAQTGLQSAEPGQLSALDAQVGRSRAADVARTGIRATFGRYDRATAKITNGLDNLPRFAAYVALREQGVTVERAAEFSRGQINFQQTSQMGRFFGNSFAFANSALAGGYANYFRRIWNEGAPPTTFVERDGVQVPVISARDVPGAINKTLVAGLALKGFVAYNAWRMLLGQDEEERERLARETPNSSFLTGFPIVPSTALGLDGDGLFDVGPETDFRIPTQYGIDQTMTYLGVMAARMVNGDADIDGIGDVMTQIVVPTLQRSVEATSPVRLDIGSIVPAENTDYRPITDTLLALVPTVFEPIARTTANRSSFGGPVRPTQSGNVRADDLFFSTPEVWRDFALGVRELTGNRVDLGGDTYEYYMKAYGGILGTTVSDIIERGNARAYAPSFSLNPFPTDRSRYYDKVRFRWQQIHRLNAAYQDDWEAYSRLPEVRAEFASKNPNYEQARLENNAMQRAQTKLKKQVRTLMQNPTDANRAQVVTLMQQIRDIDEQAAVRLKALMDSAGPVKR